MLLHGCAGYFACARPTRMVAAAGCWERGVRCDGGLGAWTALAAPEVIWEDERRVKEGWREGRRESEERAYD